MTQATHESLARKSPVVLLYAAGLVGALVAALADLMQKDDASALLVMTQKLQAVFSPGVQPLHVLGILLALGVACCFVYEPDTRPGAFNRGVGVIALLMTAVPYEQPEDLHDNTAITDTGASTRRLIPTAHAATTTPQRIARQASQIVVRLEPASGSLTRSTIKLMEASTHQVLAQSSITSSVLTFYRSPGTYLLQVESEGYRIVRDTITVPPGRSEVEIALHPARLPTAVQKLWSPGTAEFAVTSASVEPADLGLSVDNVARQLGPKEWGWTVFIEGPEASMARVTCVEYTLHPTFPDRVKKICERGSGQQAFALPGRGWGTFEVGVRVFLENESVLELKHRLTF